MQDLVTLVQSWKPKQTFLLNFPGPVAFTTESRLRTPASCALRCLPFLLSPPLPRSKAPLCPFSPFIPSSRTVSCPVYLPTDAPDIGVLALQAPIVLLTTIKTPEFLLAWVS